MIANQQQGLIDKISIGRIAITLAGEQMCQTGIIGIVVRKEYNTFIGKQMVTVVWENDNYFDYSEDDIGTEIDFFELRTTQLDGLNFQGDRVISEHIKTKFFKNLLADIRRKISEQQAQS